MKTSLEKPQTRILHTPGRFNSLYIHVPFCKNICDYCALYSVVNNDMSVREKYLEKIECDLNQNKDQLNALNTIFIGGGTPTQLKPSELSRLMNIIKQTNWTENIEFTVECNPGTVDKEKFEILKAAGVNRLSFGAQSTTRKTRNTLGRRTSHKQLLDAIDTARQCGFTNINIDLIYGVPGQEMSDWEDDLDQAIKLNLPHYSAYSLILEEGTVISDKFDKVDDELAVEMYDKIEEKLQEAGLSRYEISNYSKPGKECLHNFDIWKGGTYLGLGPAACSFDGKQRWTQIRDLNKWLDNAAPEKEELTSNEQLSEILAFGFRTVSGWKVSELKNLYGVNTLELFRSTFNDLQNQQLIEITDSDVRPTSYGLLFADTIAEAFL